MRRALPGVAALILCAVLVPLYARLSQTSPFDSDNASIELQGQALARGNILLHGWTLSNASFYTTDLPFHALAVALTGLSPMAAHAAGAAVYALTVGCAAFLARAGSSGREAAARMLVTTALLLAPAPGLAARLLLLGPYHVGTTLLLLLALIALDVGRDHPLGVATFGGLLTVAGVADPLALYVGTAATVAVCLIRFLGQGRVEWRPNALLGACGLLSVPLSLVVPRFIHHLGGFLVLPPEASFAPLGDISRHLGLTLEGTLMLFGADFFGQPLRLSTLPALLHLAGFGFALYVLWRAIVTWRHGEERDRVSQLLVALIVIDLAAYVFSNQAIDLLDTRYLVPCYVFSAILAGRLGADRLLERRLLAPAIAVALAYVGCFGVYLGTPRQPDQAAMLAAWLDHQHLRYGLGSYWDASVVTVESGGRIRVRALTLQGSRLRPYRWESDSRWYNPAIQGNDATFLVFEPQRDTGVSMRSATATFGPPSALHQVGPYEVLVWDKNLLQDIR